MAYDVRAANVYDEDNEGEEGNDAYNDPHTFGNQSFSASDIQTVVNTLDIIVFPQANPDGRNESMNSDAMWRKNRRLLPLNSDSRVGVYLNRNCLCKG